MKRLCFLILAFLVGVSFAAAKAQTITTVVGGGPNNLPGVASSLDLPQGLAADSSNNLFISTPARVYKVDRNGVLTVYAGNGFSGSTGSGDGGPATQASFVDAADLAVDSSGNLYICDLFDVTVRRVDARTHKIATVAGPFIDADLGPGAPQGIAFDRQGKLLIPVSAHGKIYKLDTSTLALTLYFAGSTPTAQVPPEYPATIPLANAYLPAPSNAAVDSHGNVFIADNIAFAVYRVDAVTHGISTIVDPGVLNQWDTYGMSTDSHGNLFIGDHSNSLVQVWNATSHTTSPAAGQVGLFGFDGDGGPATTATLNQPLAVVVRSNTTLYIADAANNRVRSVDVRSSNPAQQTISTFAGNGLRSFAGDGSSATQAALLTPNAVTSDLVGNLYIADTSNNVIRRVDANTNTITTYAGNAFAIPNGADVQDGGPATSGLLQIPEGVSLDLLGNLYIADLGDSRIRKVDSFFHRITTVAGNGEFAFDCQQLGGGTSTALGFPGGVASDFFGNLFIADQLTDCVTRYDVFTQTIQAYPNSASNPFGFPDAVARDLIGNVYVVDAFVVDKIDTRGNISTIAGTPGVPGYDGDGGPATSATLDFPLGVAVDMSGNVYIADTGNNVVRRVDARTGIITTIAGTGEAGFSGDGGPARNAQLSGPAGVYVDLMGNIFVAEFGNNRIRKISAH